MSKVIFYKTSHTHHWSLHPWISVNLSCVKLKAFKCESETPVKVWARGDQETCVPFMEHTQRIIMFQLRKMAESLVKTCPSGKPWPALKHFLLGE